MKVNPEIEGFAKSSCCDFLSLTVCLFYFNRFFNSTENYLRKISQGITLETQRREKFSLVVRSKFRC